MARSSGFLIGLGVLAPLTPQLEGMASGMPLETRKGIVTSGAGAIKDAHVVVYEAGRRSARKLGATRAKDNGTFKVTYRRSSPDSVIYILADGSDSQKQVRFATVLGTGRAPMSLTINERTTVGTAFAMSRFIDGASISGPSPGVPNAAAITRNVADLRTGGIADLLNAAPNGVETSAMPTVNTLANMMVPCVADPAACGSLFNLARSSQGQKAENTFDAMVNVAGNPGHHVRKLMDVSLIKPLYKPHLLRSAAVDKSTRNFINSWVIALRYVGDVNNPSLDGPGNIAFDSTGNAWINNNYAFDKNRKRIACGSTEVIKLTPAGHYAPGSPYGGDDAVGDGAGAGGVYGAGFGIAVDRNDGAWVASFGFQGEPAKNTDPKRKGCKNKPKAIAVNVGVFSQSGRVLSPSGDLTISHQSAETAGGWLGVPLDPKSPKASKRYSIYLPQGISSDRDGNIWVVSCGNGHVTKFVSGDPDNVVTSGNVVEKGFDLTIDPQGHVWVTGNKSQNVVELDPDGKRVGQVKGVFVHPMGIESDSQGNLWVADAGRSAPPCPALKERKPDEFDGVDDPKAAVSLIKRVGGKSRVITYGRGNDGIPRDGLRWPWGLSIDGADNVWIANFQDQRIMQLCGVAEHCDGKKVGDPISPDTGYVLNALERVTAVTVDPSGNIWATNNWIKEGFNNPENPGGRHVVVLLGVADPVKTPLLGYPEAP